VTIKRRHWRDSRTDEVSFHLTGTITCTARINETDALKYLKLIAEDADIAGATLHWQSDTGTTSLTASWDDVTVYITPNGCVRDVTNRLTKSGTRVGAKRHEPSIR